MNDLWQFLGTAIHAPDTIAALLCYFAIVDALIAALVVCRRIDKQLTKEVAR